MGNGASAAHSADLQGLFEDTVFEEGEMRKITEVHSERGVEGLLVNLLPMPLLPCILIWLKEQARKEGLSEGVTLEQIVYLLDTLHPSQLLENKRDLAWKLYDGDEDGSISQADLVGVLCYLLPALPLSKHQVLARRALAMFPNNRVGKADFERLVPDTQIRKMLTRPVIP